MASPTTSTGSGVREVEGDPCVLVIDDDDDLRALLRVTLALRGWRVVEAATSAQGLELARTLLPDLVILDRILPDLDGLEVLARLRVDPRTSDTPVLLASALGEGGRAAEAIAVGADDYMAKPFSTADLAARAERLLRDARARDADVAREGRRVEGIVGQVTDIVSWADGAGRLTYVSPAVADILGRRPEDVTGRRVDWLCHPGDTARLTDGMGGLSDGAAHRFEWRARHADGTYRWLETVARLVADPSGGVGVCATSRDVSERRLAEQAVAAAEARYRLAVDAAPIGIGETDLAGIFVSGNETLCDLLGVSPEDLVGTSSLDVLHAGDMDSAEALLEAFRDGLRRAASHDSRYVRSDGRTLWLSTNAVAIDGDDGRPERILTYYLDVSARVAEARRLTEQAASDPLTGLHNRSALLSTLDQRLGHGDGLAVLYIDLDGFKAVNDTHGHDVGDEVLKIVAERLRLATRPTDVLARLGGDEMVVVCPGAGHGMGRAIAGRVEASLGQPMAVGAHGLALGASVGIAVSVIGDDAVSLIRRADLDMYEVKRARKQLRRPIGDLPQ